MIYYALCWVVYSTLLIICTPAKTSLRPVEKASLFSRLLQNKGSCLFGTMIIVLAYYTFNEHWGIRPDMGFLLGLSPKGVLREGRYFQLITHVFMHGGWAHLLINLNSLVVLSAYERKVGFQRYCAVFLITGILGGILKLFMPVNTVYMGASGSICGLLAALAFDGAELSTLRWILSTLGLGFAITVMGLYSAYQVQTKNVHVDHLGHLVGILLGSLYTRIRPLPPIPKKTVVENEDAKNNGHKLK